MKDSLKLIIISTIIVFTLSIMSVVVRAGVISTVDIEEKATSIKVSGTTATDVNAVTISVFKEDGSTLIEMKTTSVDDTNSYSKEIDLAEGKYVVKVADYAGGAYSSKENVVVGASAGNENTNSTTENTANEENTTNEETTANETIDNTTAVEEATKKETENSKNPITGDNIAKFIALFVIATIVVFIIIKSKKSKKAGKH